MMVLHILLTILKWVGILLLAVLGLLLLFIAAVLFVPVRYRAKGSKHEQMRAYVCVSWLLHLLHITVRYEDGKPAVQLRICGIPLRRRKKKKKRAKKDTSGTDGTEVMRDDLHADAHENAETESTQDTQGNPYTDVPENAEGKASGDADPKEAPQTDVIAVSDDTEDTQKKHIFRRISDFFRHVKEVLRGIWIVLCGIRDAFLAAKDRIAYVCEQIRRMWNWRQQSDTDRAVAHVKEELRYLLQEMKPRKCDISLLLGTGDPASTGEMLGALGLVYAWTNGCFTVTPDFEEKRFEADFQLKGRIFVYQLLGVAIRLWQDEDVRTSLEAFRDR